MGLSVTLSNALSGMKVGQKSLDVLSNNVANAGTPGYHKRSLSVVEAAGAHSTYARDGGLTRSFNQSLQQHYTVAISDASGANLKASFLDRVQTLFGMPGQTGSLDTVFNAFQTSLTTLSTSPDDFATRADTVQKAQVLSQSLNRLTGDIQSLRQEIETKISTSVDDINSQLSSLEKINKRLADQGIDANSRSTLLDQRDRLINSLSEQIDLRVSYRSDDTVALLTRSGVGILDGRAATLSFENAGALSASSRFNSDDSLNNVGSLKLTTTAGLTIDLVKQNVLTSGELSALVELRDKTLVETQDQLDEIAAGLAMSMSTDTTDGTPVAGGYETNLAPLRNGNEFTFTYRQAGLDRTVRVVRVDDTSKLPIDYVDANGARVIGLDFSGGASGVANQLQSLMGSSIAVTNPSGSTLRITDDGAAGTTDMVALSSRPTVSGLQNGLALSLFVDTDNGDFTNSLDGIGQRRGFAGRIAVNSEVTNNNKLLVQYAPGGSLGDASRANQLLENLQGLRFSGGLGQTGKNASFRLAGTVADLIGQTVNYQGNAASTALTDKDTQAMTLDALGQRLEGEYGVDVDEEMARLMELQNAFAANARVMQVAQQLIDSLLQM